MKKICSALTLTTAFCFGMGSSNVPPLNEIDENERAMSHVNYIQYELAKIRISGDKFTVIKELDNVLNTINPTTLKHESLINEYENILGTMETLRASDVAMERLSKKLEDQRKNAIFNSFSGLGASFLNPNPVAMASALIMAGFNYAKTVNEIDNEGSSEQLKITDSKKQNINKARIQLWTSASKIFMDSKYESTTFINEKMMENYMKEDFKLEASLDKSTARSVYTYLTLPEVESQFKYFIPYYVTLLKAGYAENDASKIKKNYKRIVELSNAEYKNFYIKNPYLHEATKYALLYLMKHNEEQVDGLPIDEMIEIFKKEGDKSRVSVVEDEYFLVGVYEYLNEKKKNHYYGKIKESLARLNDLNVENDTTDLYSKYKCLESKDRENDYCYRLSKKVAKDLLKKITWEIDSEGTFKVSVPLDANITATCADRFQGTIFWGARDRTKERENCIKSVESFEKMKDGDAFVFRAENVGPLEHEKINVNVKFKMGKWNVSAFGVADYKNELSSPFELRAFEK